MLGKTHLAAGIAAGAAVCLTRGLDIMPGAICLACAGLGSLLPDIDQRNSTINKVAKPVGTVVSAVAGHRTVFHDPVLYMAAAAAGLWFKPEWLLYIIAVLIGVGSHLLLDALNPAGVPIFTLFHGPKIHLAGIHTGSGMDKFLGFFFTVVGRLALVVWLATTVLKIWDNF